MLDTMLRHRQAEIPTDLRLQLETARLDLLALFRAMDNLYLTPEQIPQRLIRQLFELDAERARHAAGYSRRFEPVTRRHCPASEQPPATGPRTPCAT